MKKILLIHGWNYANYTSLGCKNAWENRSKFVESLSKHFNVVTINLPGFCGQADPEFPWGLDDFVWYVDRVIEKEKPDYLLGYSFGGAIALRWKKMTGDIHIKTFLVSPAIMRRYESKDLGLLQKSAKALLPTRVTEILRDFYLTKVVKNPYYVHATRVMRETYRNIVSVDLRKDLMGVSDSLTLIYGELDSATPPDLIRVCLEYPSEHHELIIIPFGGHDIANSHTSKLVAIITKTKEVCHEAKFEDFETNSSGC